MHSPSLRLPASTSFSLCVFLAGACAQSSALTAQSAGSNNKPVAPAADVKLEGLPSFLLLVPGGSVQMGLKAEAVVDAACQVVNPTRPGVAVKIAASKVTTNMRHSASLLGQRKVDVQPFLLAKWPVKGSEYAKLLQLRRQNGKMRPPFSWWRNGCIEHYNEKLPEIAKLFPQDDMGPLLFWEQNGPDLPYRVQDEDGRSLLDHPVTYVDFKEAQDFAAWLGMRLPTEAEWTRAARGDGTHIWPWGAADPTADVFSEEALRALRIYNSSDKVLKPVGTVKAAVGPYGHVDMFGQVWQLVSGPGFGPITGDASFAEEWKRLQKDKTGALLQSQPVWKKTDRVLAKGGCWLSSGDPIQLLLDARADFQTIDVLEGAGFRLAKSLRPGYDLLYSLLRGNYNRAAFAGDQEIDLAGQIGAERYEMGADGFPTQYDAVSFAPVNWLSIEKNADLPKLLEKSQQAPILIGTFATTKALLEPAAPAGHYSVLFRKEGVPRELLDAMKAGHKEMGSRKPKDDGKEGGSEGDKDKEQEKKSGWREVLARFGLTDKDLEGKDAKEGPEFVRVGGFEVPTKTDVFLLHNNEGKVVAAIPAPSKRPAAGTPFAPEFLFEADNKSRTVAKFRVGMPLSQLLAKKVLDVHFHVVIDGPMPGGDKPWRLPGK